MLASPGRHAKTMHESNWPLHTLQTPRLTLSPASSNESFYLPMPTTPRFVPAGAEAMLLPGFHFSTTDANVDPAEFHRVAAQLLSGESNKHDSAQYIAEEREQVREMTQERHLHCNLGRDPSGRYCCSCGKSYSTGFRLYEHTQQCAGTLNYPCMSCDKVSNSPPIDPMYESQMRKSMSQHYWIYEGDHSWQTHTRESNDSGYESDEPEAADQTMDFVKNLLRQPGSCRDRISCDLCGETFSTRGDALAQHMGNHSLDFTEKRHKCDECRIYFANEKDLERHLQSSNLNQHCGFTFHHNTRCTGHHPPTYFKAAFVNDHNLMQKHLWTWELCQLRSHRVAIARILAEKLNRMNPARPMSLQDCRRTYASMLPHFSIAASRDSVRELDDQALSSLDAHFSQVLDEVYPESTLATLRNAGPRPDSGIIASRPESKRLSKRKSLVDLAKRLNVEEKVKSGHKRHALSASGFALLRQQADREKENRHASVPVMRSAAIAV
ncbi:hypothetical protein AC579_6991 [Pseudocercospora musae]|uniref:C2H2-type domain-containing protein n=1 Tax=Pseudocercospora musae TaxID=113226 RepID=A0A139I9E9_9PEZI|nr:hypothetical protein AC579_6991 [Pseudocercospora musae]